MVSEVLVAFVYFAFEMAGLSVLGFGIGLYPSRNCSGG